MQQTKVLETWVGVFVILGAVSLFFLAMNVSNLADLQVKDNSYRVFARFQNVGSLRPRSPVTMGGVRIGRVSAIRFDKETYEAVVEMRIEPEYDTIPTDTTANVLTAGLLGEQYIGLSAGGSDEFLKNGDEIELSQSAMVLEEVISRFLFNKAEGSEKKETASSDTALPVEAKSTAENAELAGDRPAAQPKPADETPVAKPKAKPEKSNITVAPEHKPKPLALQQSGSEPAKAAAKALPVASKVKAAVGKDR